MDTSLQDDLLTELLQKNGGKGECILSHYKIHSNAVPFSALTPFKPITYLLSGSTGVKIIRAPKKKEESAQETPSPYNAAPAPAPGPASKKATPSASQQV